MSHIKAADFLIALANFVAAKSPPLKRTASPSIELFTSSVDEDKAAACYHVLRHYDGDAASHLGRRHVAVQCETKAKASDTQAAAVVALRGSEDVHARLIAPYGPLKQTTFGGFLLLAIVDLRPPRLIGGLDNGRQRAVFNFDAYYVPPGT